MTPKETKLLQQGRVPTAPIKEQINRALSTYGLERDDESGHLTILCDKAQVLIGEVESAFEKSKDSSLDFNVADRLICAAGLYHAWRGELAELYYGVDLSRQTCANRGCRKLVNDGVKFCSETCARGDHIHPRLETACRKGHVRTPENTKHRRDRLICLECRAERNAAKWKGGRPKRSQYQAATA